MKQLEIAATKAFSEDGNVQFEVGALLLSGNHKRKAQQCPQLHLVFQLLAIRRRSDDGNQGKENDRDKLEGSLGPSA